MLGDFNARNCAWKDSDVTDSSGRALQLAFVQYGFTVINKDGTRPNMRSGCTPLLDIVATNIPDIISSTTTLPPLSDHCPVIVSLTLRAPTPQRTALLHRTIDFNRLRFLMEGEPFLERLYGCETVDASWKAWESHFLNLVERSSDWVRKRSTWVRKRDQRNQTWYTPDLRQFQRRQNRLYHAYLRNPQSTEAKAAYCVSRNIYRKKIRAARSAFLDRNAASISKGCTKGGYVWWRRVKDFCNISTRKPLIPDLQDGDRRTNTQLEKVNLLAQHFANQCTLPQEANQFPCLDSSLDTTTPRFQMPTFSPGQVHYDLTHLSSRKSTSSINHTILFQYPSPWLI
eukprot:scpid23535/ scgid4916/ 